MLKVSKQCQDGMFVLFKDNLYPQGWMIASEFDNLAAQYGDRVSFLIVEQDLFPDIAHEYAVTWMYTTVYFHNGTRIAAFHGHNKQEFKNFITEYASAV